MYTCTAFAAHRATWLKAQAPSLLRRLKPQDLSCAAPTRGRSAQCPRHARDTVGAARALARRSFPTILAAASRAAFLPPAHPRGSEPNREGARRRRRAPTKGPPARRPARPTAVRGVPPRFGCGAARGSIPSLAESQRVGRIVAVEERRPAGYQSLSSPSSSTHGGDHPPVHPSVLVFQYSGKPLRLKGRDLLISRLFECALQRLSLHG